MELKEYAAVVIQDGKVDVEEAKKLRELIYADGKIDKEEVDILFEINDAVSGAENCEEYEDLFVETVCAFVLADEETPDEISQEEGDYLAEKLSGDGKIDSLEERLLLELSARADEIYSDKLIELIEQVEEGFDEEDFFDEDDEDQD